MSRPFLLSLLVLISVFSQAQPFPGAREDLSPYYKAINNIYANRRVNRHFSREIFGFSAGIRPMKEFFIRNASRVLRPKPLPCINTLKAGLETLFYGASNIPYSPTQRSERALFRTAASNRIIDLVKNLSDSGCINDYKDIYFIGRNRVGDTVIINENNFIDSVKILAMAGSVWHAIVAMLPQVKGWSVFCVSLSNGHHTATIAVNHVNLHDIKMYWADQSSHHEVREEDRLKDIPGRQLGWERMTEYATAKTRSLDEYCLYAVREFLYSLEEEADGVPELKRNMPIIRIWRISKVR